MNKNFLRTFSFFAAAWVVFSAAGCGPKETPSYYYMAAKQTAVDGNNFIVITFVRRFEKQNWCLAEKDGFIKRGVSAACTKEEKAYEPFFRGEATGKWYALQRMGRFPPSVLIYEPLNPFPDGLMLAYMQESAPHVLKFAALHEMPAEVRIFSPSKEELLGPVK